MNRESDFMSQHGSTSGVQFLHPSSL